MTTNCDVWTQVRRWDLLPGGIQSDDGMPSRVLLPRWFVRSLELCHGFLLGRRLQWLHVMRSRDLPGLDRHHELQRYEPRCLELTSYARLMKLVATAVQ